MKANILQRDEMGWLVEIPQEIIQQLEWNGGDDVNLEITTDCYDWGETYSIIVSNETKIKAEKDER